jgi:hypothetical protein
MVEDLSLLGTVSDWGLCSKAARRLDSDIVVGLDILRHRRDMESCYYLDRCRTMAGLQAAGPSRGPWQQKAVFEISW